MVEAFSLRGLTLIADSWAVDPWVNGEGRLYHQLATCARIANS